MGQGTYMECHGGRWGVYSFCWRKPLFVGGQDVGTWLNSWWQAGMEWYTPELGDWSTEVQNGQKVSAHIFMWEWCVEKSPEDLQQERRREACSIRSENHSSILKHFTCINWREASKSSTGYILMRKNFIPIMRLIILWTMYGLCSLCRNSFNSAMNFFFTAGNLKIHIS